MQICAEQRAITRAGDLDSLLEGRQRLGVAADAMRLGEWGGPRVAHSERDGEHQQRREQHSCFRPRRIHTIQRFENTRATDVDLCLKIGQLGYRILYTPYALLYHYEGFSRTPKDLIPNPVETERMRKKWKKVIDHDPFYSPNLTRLAEDYSLRKKR